MAGKLDKLLEMKCIKSHKSSGGTKTACEAVEGPITKSFPNAARTTNIRYRGTAGLLRFPT